MPGLKAIPVCKVCGAPRDPNCTMAFCTDHARAYYLAQSRKHKVAASNLSRIGRLRETYTRMNVRALLERR